MENEKLLKSWTDYGIKHLQGKKIVEVRYLSDSEVEALGWYSSALVMILDDGTLIFPSADDEGNNAGALFGQTAEGEELTFPLLGV